MRTAVEPMQSHHLDDLPPALGELFLTSFPTLRESAAEIEVLWLEQTDFPRLKKEDLETDHPVVVIGGRSWRISHAFGEDLIQPLEPVAIPARPAPAPPRESMRTIAARWSRRATLPVGVGLLAFALGLVFPARSSILEAHGADAPAITQEDLRELARHWAGDAGDGAIRFLEAEGSSSVLLQLVEAHHPARRVRALAARLRAR
jgi:hypothetical protein